LLGGDGAHVRERVGAGKINLRLRQLRLQTGDLRVERIHLKLQLVVADQRDLLPLTHFVAVADG
jgi:hypothetical protein